MLAPLAAAASVTEIAYHPTRLRALRDSFRALRAAEFPWTADTVYLNNASIGPIPERTRRAIDEFNFKRTAPHLLPDRDLQAGLHAAREVVARLLNAETGEIALTTNTGFGLHAAARALPLKRGDVVLLSDREFPANVYPWLLLKKAGSRGGAGALRTAKAGPMRTISSSGWKTRACAYWPYRSCSSPTATAAISRGWAGVPRERHVLRGGRHSGNWKLGARRARDAGGHPRLRRPEVAALALGLGVHVRAARDRARCSSRTSTGWMAFEGTDDFSRLTEYNPTFRSDARRFEMITLPYQDFCGLTTSVGMLCDLGVRDIAEHTRALHEPVLQWADANGVRVTSPRDDAHRSAIICLAPEHAAEAYHAVKRAHIVCSLREGAIRLAPHCFNTVEEMERVLDVLDQVE